MFSHPLQRHRHCKALASITAPSPDTRPMPASHPDRRHHPVARQYGVSMVELLVCICVVATLAGVAVPQFASMIERNRAIAASNAVMAQLYLARTTAVSRRTATVLCPSSNGAHCSNGTDWSKDWLMFLDRDGNGRPDAPTDIIRAEPPPASGLQLFSTAGRTRIRYLPDGRSSGSNLTLSICGSDGSLLSKVIVNNAGRARSQRGGNVDRCTK
mgnify:CR=1 FL=1